MEAVPESTTDITCGSMDLNENTQSGLKGEVQRGIRVEVSGITVASAKPGVLKVDDDLAADGCNEVAVKDGRRYIRTTASPVHVEECGGCGVWADAGCAPGALPTLREEEEDDEDEVASSNTDSCSVISSDYDSLNSSTECLLLNVSHPELFGELSGADAGVADLLRSIMEEKTSQLGKISMRCTNCLEKFHWSGNELEACLFKHLAKCWHRKMGVSHLSPIEENDMGNELQSFEKEIVRAELSGVKSLVSALHATEWDFKPIRCGQDGQEAPECYRDHCKEARCMDQIQSDASSDTQVWDGDFEDDEMDIEKLEYLEREMKNSFIDSVEDEALDDSVVAEQRMMVMLVTAKSSIWKDKMAAVLGLTTRATLDDLDSVLRRLWVECCGHASSLTVGEKTFTFPDLEGDLDKLSIKDKDDQCDQVGGQTAIESVFGKIGSTASYTYDPVHPTVLNISFMGTMDLTFTEEAEFPSHTDFYLRGADMVRPSRRSSLSAAILLRNVRPEVVCAECRERYVLLLDSSIVDVRLPEGSKPHGGLFHPVGFCSMDCVVAFNQEMSLVPDHNDSVQVERANLVYMSNSPRAGTCRYASLELDSSVNTRTTDSTTYSAFTMDTSCSCVDCASDCSQNCSTCDYTDTDHSYSKSEGSPQVPVSSILARTGGTPVLTGYSSRSTSVDTPPTKQ